MAGEQAGIEQEAAQVAIPGAATATIPSTDCDAEVPQTQQRSSSPKPESGAFPQDVEARAATTPSSDSAAEVKYDIEHMPVRDDPRLWSKGRKYGIVAIVSAGALSESRLRSPLCRWLPCH